MRPSILLCLLLGLGAHAQQVRSLDLPLSGLLTGQDLRTPEGAYGVITQLMLTGKGDWKAVSAAHMARHFTEPAKPMVPMAMVPDFQRAKVVEVHQGPTKAAVIAALPSGLFDVRHLALEGGKWLNTGEDGCRSLEEARRLARKTVIAETPTVRTLDLPMAQAFEAKDMATPEAAYGIITRLMLQGGDWRPVSITKWQSLKEFQKPAGGMPEPHATAFREGKVVEVQAWGDRAVVIAALGNGSHDLRLLNQEEGRWLNAGENMAPSLASARTMAQRHLGVKTSAPKEAPVADPKAHLARFASHLAKEGREPKAFMLEALASHRLTILGETHNRPLYWDFNARLVQDPAFARHVGTIYLELSASHQGHMDRFLGVPSLDPTPLVEMLRDTHVEGWPGQCTVDFLSAVWKTNQSLPVPQRLRVVLVDNLRDWSKIQTQSDWTRQMRGRDNTMARTILQDLDKGDGRHGFFIVGKFHTELDFHAEGSPNAGTLLRQALKDQVFVVVQHSVVQEDRGKVHGRARGGLFDEAFRDRKDLPVAFPLKGSPFGAERYDCHPELQGMAKGTYGSCFDAYLFLGPVDEERLSPLIPGFYTETFLKELDRRLQVFAGM